jgi:hypothetical protein
MSPSVRAAATLAYRWFGLAGIDAAEPHMARALVAYFKGVEP